MNENEREKIYAVLTGDFIKSSIFSLSEIDASMTELNSTVRNFKEQYQNVIVGEPSIFRGDSWQVLVSKPSLALRLVFQIRANLRSKKFADTRVSIGIGSVTKINNENISMSQGQAFKLSGHGLDEMSSNYDLDGHLPSSHLEFEVWFRLTMFFCSEIVRAWTRRQSEIVGLALVNKDQTHKELSKLLFPAIKQQTVSNSLKGANWNVINECLKVFEKTNWDSQIQIRKLTNENDCNQKNSRNSM